MPDGTPTEPTDRITKQRVAEYFQLLFSMLVENGGSMPRKEILEQFPVRLKMTPHELSLTKSELPRWLTTMHMWSIDFQKAGLFNRAGGVWTITDEGRRQFASLDPAAFFQLARKRYAEWRANREDAEIDEEDEDADGDVDGESTQHASRPVWLIGTGSGAVEWQRFKTNSEIAICFAHVEEQVGNLSAMTREQIHARLKALTGARNPKMDSLACWEFANAMREGEVVIARSGNSKLLGIGRISGPYVFDPSAKKFAHSRRVEWIDVHDRAMPERLLLPTKTLTEMSQYPDIVDLMLGVRTPIAVSLLESQGHDTASIDAFFAQLPYVTTDPNDSTDAIPAYSAPEVAPTLEAIDSESFATRAELESIMAALATKRAVVLQGSPGTGKTYLAQKLAHHYAGSMERVHRVQFHPAYSYEDFVRGIRPTGAGFAVENGPLVRISEEARRAPREQFVLLIDEINRGNVAKILGEALSLIEVDKRDPKHKVKLGLALNGDYDFWIPPNVAILATMNTADRSIALVDYALRRRFAFIRLTPAYNRSEFKDWLLDQFSPGAGESLPSNDQSKAVALAITETMIAINEHIVSDKAFGDGFAIGHSFFCTYEPRHGEAPQRWANRVFEQEIGPLIEEYCVEHPSLRKKLLALVPNF